MNDQPKDAYDNHARALEGSRSNGHMPLLAGEVAEYRSPIAKSANLFGAAVFRIAALMMPMIGTSR
jgi:hypothetical protein